MDAKTDVKMRCCEELPQAETNLQELRYAEYFKKKLERSGDFVKNSLQFYIEHLTEVKRIHHINTLGMKGAYHG